MALQDWIRGYGQLLTFRAPGYPARTLERYWAYRLAALLLVFVLIAGMAWMAFRAAERGKKARQQEHLLNRANTPAGGNR